MSKKIVHPDYNQPTILNNDIGLVKMKVEMTAFTKFVSPLCLPSIGDTGFGTSAYGNGSESVLDTTGLDIVGRTASVLGWGVVNDGKCRSLSLTKLGNHFSKLIDDRCSNLRKPQNI